MKTLQIALGNQFDIRDALTELGDVIYYDWSGRNKSFNFDIRALVDKHQPDIVFLQLQTPGVISREAAKYISSKSFVINWTGDVRHPLPSWFKEIGPYCLSLFTNMNDVEEMRRLGFKSDYLQIGFPEKIFTPKGEKKVCPEIIFMANYTRGFPMSNYRLQIVEKLKARYGKRFAVYGNGWGNGYHAVPDQHEEARFYRGCKIAINLSHFNYKRYSSDRIFRLMGAGAFCLSHHYPEIETEFTPGVHLDVWRDENHLIEKIEHYLSNDSERKKIAKAGCDHVHNNYKWANRINELAELISEYK